MCLDDCQNWDSVTRVKGVAKTPKGQTFVLYEMKFILISKGKSFFDILLMTTHRRVITDSDIPTSFLFIAFFSNAKVEKNCDGSD